MDGNTPDNPAGEPTDWDAPVSAQNPPLTITPFTDATGTNDDSLGMGSKQEEPGNWSCITGSSPQKGDITPGGKIAFRTINGKQFVYVNFTRRASEGSADIDYEFSQSAEPNPSCPSLPKRTPATSCSRSTPRTAARGSLCGRSIGPATPPWARSRPSRPAPGRHLGRRHQRRRREQDRHDRRGRAEPDRHDRRGELR